MKDYTIYVREPLFIMKGILHRLFGVIYKTLLIVLTALFYLIVSIPVIIYLPIEVIGIVMMPIFSLLLYIFTGESHGDLLVRIYGKNDIDSPLFIVSYPIVKYLNFLIKIEYRFGNLFWN